MIDVRGDIVIARPLPEVFEFAADLDNLPQWLDGCKKAWSPDGDGRSAGAEIVHEDEFMGRTFEARFEVLEWEDCDRIVSKAVSGPFRGVSEETFRDEDGDTRIEIHVTGEPAGFLKAVGFMAKRQAQMQIDRSLENLRRVLEEDA
jgi:uncharacterized membrane protein